MSRRARTRMTMAALALTAAVLLPSSQAAAGGAELASAAGGPVAHKSGAIVNFLPAGKLKVAKNFQPLAICSVDCNVTVAGLLKGMGGKATFADAGSFLANQPFGLKITVKGSLLKLMKANPGRFHLAEKYTATDPATGAIDTIKRRFNFKR